jgi:phytoene synthase
MIQDTTADIAQLEASVKGSSFYNAMRLMPLARKHAMFAIYAFCREVDDIADGDADPLEKRRLLDEWRLQIDGVYDGRATHPVARALIEPTRTYHLRREDYIAVIDGMDMDAIEDIVAPSMEKLDLYCDRVASAVGRLSVRIFGADGPPADAVAYSLGRALQLSNILRDIAEDAERGRLYLPSDLLRRHGMTDLSIPAVLAHPGLSAACFDLVDIAYAHFTQAQEAMTHCPRKAMRTARLMGAAYRAILDKVVARGFVDLERPVKISTWKKLWIVARYGLI